MKTTNVYHLDKIQVWEPASRNEMIISPLTKVLSSHRDDPIINRRVISDEVVAKMPTFQAMFTRGSWIDDAYTGKNWTTGTLTVGGHYYFFWDPCMPGIYNFKYRITSEPEAKVSSSLRVSCFEPVSTWIDLVEVWARDILNEILTRENEDREKLELENEYRKVMSELKASQKRLEEIREKLDEGG